MKLLLRFFVWVGDDVPLAMTLKPQVLRFEEMAWMVLVFILAAVIPLPCESSLESNPLFKPPPLITFPNYTLYHTLDTLLDEVKSIVSRNPKSMHLDTLSSATKDGYRANVHTVTIGRNHTNSKTLRILLNFGQHARELITSELALHLLRTWAEQPVLSQTVIKVIPIENVNGRRRVEAGALCERKNGRGVDTNRNWGVDWGRKEKDYDPAEEYPGTAPFSEPETQIVRDLVAEFRPHVWVNVHSGMEALFMPYDHRRGVPEGRGAEAVRKMLEGVSGKWCGGRCVVGSGGESVGYLSHGTATDYVYDVAKVPIALTLEIYGDEKAPNEDCFRMFNPITSHEVDEVISKWTAIFSSLVEKLPSTVAAFREDSMFVSYEDEEKRKFGRVWQGMDTMSEGLRTQASLQFYLILCALLLVVAWVRCGRFCKRVAWGGFLQVHLCCCGCD